MADGSDRRGFLGAFLSGTVGLAAGAGAMWKFKPLPPEKICPPIPPLPREFDGLNQKNDILILNEALGLEHQAIAAYTAGAGLNVLSPEALAVAGSFLKQHEQHRDILRENIERMKGNAVMALASYNFDMPSKPGELDVLKLALSLEEGAVQAYHIRLPKIFDRDLINGAAAILGDEAGHVIVLRQVLKLPPPGTFLSYKLTVDAPVASAPMSAPVASAPASAASTPASAAKSAASVPAKPAAGKSAP